MIWSSWDLMHTFLHIRIPPSLIQSTSTGFGPFEIQSRRATTCLRQEIGFNELYIDISIKNLRMRIGSRLNSAKMSARECAVHLMNREQMPAWMLALQWRSMAFTCMIARRTGTCMCCGERFKAGGAAAAPPRLQGRGGLGSLETWSATAAQRDSSSLTAAASCC